MIEHRRHARTPIHAPVEFSTRGQESAPVAGVGKDISVGGMFIETATPATFGASIVVHLRLPGRREEIVLPATVRWTRGDGMGVQFGLLGVRETHAITELGRKNG